MSIDVGVFQILPDGRADPAVVARAAEDLGFSSYWVPEHAPAPDTFESVYPGNARPTDPTPDYIWEMPNPWVALARASAVTTKIRLGTAVCLVPQSNPLMLAKEIASLDHFSGGRVEFGIGAGWNREEAEMMGVDFDHRWTQTAECVEIIKKLWTERAYGHDGRYYRFPPVRCLPKPARKPHPRILLGNIGSPKALGRVVRYGDGWLPAVGSADEIAAGRKRLNELCAEQGRDPSSVYVGTFAYLDRLRTRADREAIEEAGADELIIWIRAYETADILVELKALAAELIT